MKKIEIDWIAKSRSTGLTEAFIEEHENKVYWPSISSYQILSETFIEKHADKVIWQLISSCQILSEAFIEKFEGEICWEKLFSERQGQQLQLSTEFRKKHAERFQWGMSNEEPIS
ncbi:hypothetical protein [Cytophaga hutchinsonii]|uniref:Uncharacterized protein n=1 Tax=Cytophaga hutchinsonii (strain ATCC 33406 / DSM 1761 / CIP 103989 / NBRC 15051 / NCIMB 9469 / D465) TaxID=269798 RepID=A0A6N4SPM7_CYTH3|nr:hypothetical protein [Cytophaga hutchinsonii]ABG58277.1 conserved hypothetical protein; tryptophan repeat family protein [Cytophaga hutchinsonii ATCC 33406]SFX53510.1 hypothetical protein SAMN04487930_105153 [Cytophaga hutchinsonii ATCC 33406]